MNHTIECRKPQLKNAVADCLTQGMGLKRTAKAVGVRVATLRALCARHEDLRRLRAGREGLVELGRLPKAWKMYLLASWQAQESLARLWGQLGGEGSQQE